MSEQEQIKELARDLCSSTMCDLERYESCLNKDGNCSRCQRVAEDLYKMGYYRLRRCTFELPCLVGDYVCFKGLEEPWKVSAIHLYSNGAPQISITSPSGKITSTMTFLEFEEFATIINPKKQESRQ